MSETKHVTTTLNRYSFLNILYCCCHVFGQTRLLVTNSVAYLQQMDTIVVLKNGEISEMGTFQELLSHKAAFAEFILTYLNDPDVSGELDPDCECHFLVKARPI